MLGRFNVVHGSDVRCVLDIGAGSWLFTPYLGGYSASIQGDIHTLFSDIQFLFSDIQPLFRRIHTLFSGGSQDG